MKYDINSLIIKREEFDKLFAQAEDFDYETGIGKRKIGKSEFLVLEDQSTGTHVCFAIRNINKKTANARLVINAKLDEEANVAEINFSRKSHGFDVALNEKDTSEAAFFADLEYNTTENKNLDEIYDALQQKPIFGVIVDEEVEADAQTASEETIEAPVAATFMPKVMKVEKLSAKSKSQFFKEDETLYLIVCPDKNGELSVWLANDKIVSIDAESGDPKFERTGSDRPWERVLQENENVVSNDVKKLSRAKSREFFRKGAVATIWQEAGNKGKEKVVLTAKRKEIKEFLTAARNAYGKSVEKENGTVKNIKKVFKKARYALTGFVAGAALTAIVLAGGLTTGNIDKAEAAKNYGRSQVGISAKTDVEEIEAGVVAANVENGYQGKLFNYVKDEYGNKKVSDCMGLSEVAASTYEKYKSGLGYLKYGFKQNEVYGEATLQGIGEALAEAAVAELADKGVVLAEEENGETKTNVVYPVGNKTMEEASEKANMVSFLVLNGMEEADAQVVADAYENTFRAKASVAVINVGPKGYDPSEADFSTAEVEEAISKAIESTKNANGDTAAWKVEYVSTQDQIAVVSTDEFLYTIDLSKRDEENNLVPINTQEELMDRFEAARLDGSRVSFAFDANELYGDEALVKLVTDKFVEEHREYKSAKAYVGAFDVQTTEDGKTRFKQVTTMIVEQADGKNAVIIYVANEVGSKSVAASMVSRSAASFFAAVGFRNTDYPLYESQNPELYVMNRNEYDEAEVAAAEAEVAPAETPIEAGEYTLGN